MQLRQFRSGLAAGAAVPVVIVLGLGACGSTSESTRPDDDEKPPVANVPMNTSYKPGSRELPDDSKPSHSNEMKVDLEVGFLDENDVQEAIERNWRALTHCYQRAGAAQRYVGGEVRLQFVVMPSGVVDDIHVIENGLGNYAVERCLVVEGRRIAFRAPEGGKNATFEYPINFRSAHEISVVDWPSDALASDISPLLDRLTPCPRLGPAPVRAVAYIEPSGQVGSVGFVSAGAIDPEAGVCVLEQIRAWHLPGDPGHVVRTTFAMRLPDPNRPAARIPPAAAGLRPMQHREEAAPPRKAAPAARKSQARSGRSR